MRVYLPLPVVLLIACVSRPLTGENWAQFRGPNANGVATEKELPARWGPDTNIAWKIKLPGVAWSQPIVWGDNVFVTTAVTYNQQKPGGGQSGPGFGIFGRGFLGRGSGDSRPTEEQPPERTSSPEDDPPTAPAKDRPRLGGFPFSFGFLGGDPPDVTYRWKVLCIDGTTGDVLWEQLARENRPSIPIHRSNTYASETPATDGEVLVAYFGMTGLYCYDLTGELLWSKEMGTYPMQFGWGTGSSPVLHDGRVYVQCDNETTSFLAALDRKTGDELWRVDRDERSNWCTPYIWRNKRRTELVTTGGNKVRSYDPDTGELFWEMGSSGRSATTPVADEDLIYVGCVDRLMGRSGLLAAVRAGATDDISLKKDQTTNSFVAWSIPRGAPPIASPLLYAGCLYVLPQHGGVIRCYDAKTGTLHYRQRLPGASGFTSSPWASDGKVFCLDEDGRTFVLEAGPKLKVVTVNELDEMFWSSAAVIGRNLLLRGVDHLYCISEGKISH